MYALRVMRLRAVKGTYDVLPERQPAWRHLRETVARVLGRAGVSEIATPIFEHADVFRKSVGESADLVVQKEMYTFEDRGGRTLVLRPEFTAGVLRAYVEHGMHTRPTPVKLWSLGPAFRAENVQRGRYRQFHQVNAEFLGLAGPLLDAEAIALLHALLTELGLPDLRVALGSVGDPEDREAYNAYLREALEPRAAELSETSRERLRLNPMRVLDSKDEGDQALVAGLDKPLDRIGDAAVDEAAALARSLRGELHVEHAYRRRTAGKGLRDADRARARFAALRGERERERDVWSLKDLAAGEQRDVRGDELAAAAREA